MREGCIGEQNSRIGKRREGEAIRKLELDEEVEGEKEKAEHKKDGAEGKAALGEAADRMQKAGRDYAEARFGAR